MGLTLERFIFFSFFFEGGLHRYSHIPKTSWFDKLNVRAYIFAGTARLLFFSSPGAERGFHTPMVEGGGGVRKSFINILLTPLLFIITTIIRA